MYLQLVINKKFYLLMKAIQLAKLMSVDRNVMKNTDFLMFRSLCEGIRIITRTFFFVLVK